MKVIEELSKIFIMIVLCVISLKYYLLSKNQFDEIRKLQEMVTLHHIAKLADMGQLNDDSYQTVHNRLFPKE